MSEITEKDIEQFCNDVFTGRERNTLEHIVVSRRERRRLIKAGVKADSIMICRPNAPSRDDILNILYWIPLIGVFTEMSRKPLEGAEETLRFVAVILYHLLACTSIGAALAFFGVV